MNEAAAVAFVFAAIGLLWGADSPRGVPRSPLIHSRARLWVARAAAAALVTAALVAWRAAEAGPAAFLAVPVALMAAGTLVTLLAALAPRLAQGLVIAAVPVGVLLVLLGGVR